MKTNKLILIFILFLVSLKDSYAQYTLQDSLEAYYPFNGNANDESGNGYDGVVLGASLIADRNLNTNSAYNFDGIDDQIELPEEFDFPSRTIIAWFYARSVISTTLFIYHSDGATVQNGNTVLGVSGIDSLSQVVSFAGGGPSSVFHPIQLDKWYMTSLVVDGDSNYYYLNDSLIGIRANSGLSAPFLWPGSTIGSREDDRLYFDGLIDDVLIYSRSLSGSEIDSIYNGAVILDIETPELLTRSIEIYPNPVNDYLNVQLKEVDASSSYEIQTTDGKIMSAGLLEGTYNKIDLKSFPSSIYLLRLYLQDQTQTIKFLK